MKKEKPIASGEMSDELDFGLWLMDGINVLMKYKKMIAVIMTVCLIFSAITGFFILKPQYESKAAYLIKIPDFIETPYGDFTFPSKNLSEYGAGGFESQALLIAQKTINAKAIFSSSLPTVNYSSEQIKAMTNIKIDDSNARLTVTVRADTPQEAYRLAKILESSYLISMNSYIKRMVMETFATKIDRDTAVLADKQSDLEEEINTADELLKSVSQFVTTQNVILDKNQAAAFYASETGKELKDMGGSLMLSQIVNPEYENIQILLAQLKMDANKTKAESMIAQKNEKKLNDQIAKLNESIKNGTDGNAIEAGLNMQSIILTVLQSPEVDNTNVRMSTFLIIALALVFGLMLGVFIAFIREFLVKYNGVGKQ